MGRTSAVINWKSIAGPPVNRPLLTENVSWPIKKLYAHKWEVGRERENVNEPTRTHLGRRGDPDDGRFNSSFVLNDSYRSWLKQKGSNRPYFSLLYTWLCVCVCVHRGCCCCCSIGFSLPKLLRQFHKPTLGDPGRGFFYSRLSFVPRYPPRRLSGTHTHSCVTI